MANKDLSVDIVIMGAGPAGLAAACRCQELDLSYLIIDRAGLAHSFSEYPDSLLFFSPPEDMEIGGVPLPVAGGLKPTRETYLSYLRGVVRARDLHLATWESVVRCEARGTDGFVMETRREPNRSGGRRVTCRAVILATGVWGTPFTLGVPGCDLPHVFSEFHEPTAFYGQPVLVIGGGNSAVGAALSLAEARAEVSLSTRRPPRDYQSGLRPFVRRDLGFAVEEGKVTLLAGTIVREIRHEEAILQPVQYTGKDLLAGSSLLDYVPTGEPFAVRARFVFSLIGHMPDTDILEDLFGLRFRLDGRPEADLGTWETSVPNIFLAGSIADDSIDVVAALRRQAVQVVDTLARRIR